MCRRVSGETVSGEMLCRMLCGASRPRLSGRAKLDFLLAAPGTLMHCHGREALPRRVQALRRGRAALQRRVQALTWKSGASAPRTSINKDWGFSPGNSPNNNRSIEA